MNNNEIKVTVNDEYLKGIAHQSFADYMDNTGVLEAVYGDIYKVRMQIVSKLTNEIDNVVISVPSEYGKLIDAEVINVRYESGIARDEARFGENTGVDYMLAKIGDIELYAELPAVDPDEDDIEEQEELLMASIKKQAREAGINTKLLNFGK